jgi:hypothetical protein
MLSPTCCRVAVKNCIKRILDTLSALSVNSWLCFKLSLDCHSYIFSFLNLGVEEGVGSFFLYPRISKINHTKI